MNTWLNYFFGDWKGNIGRINRIFKEDYGWFINHASNILGNVEKANAIVLEAFNAAYKQHKDFQSKDEIFLFLSSTIDQSCAALKEMQKALKHEIQQELKEEEQIKKLILYRGSENYIITKEVREAVHEVIGLLPKKCKEVFSLFFCGCPEEEVAKMVDRKITTVRTHKNKASIIIFKALQQKGLLIRQNLPPFDSFGFISPSDT